MTRSSGVQNDGTWLPAFAGQRRAFAEGNSAAMRHGAYSSKFDDRVVEIAESVKVAMGDTFQESFAAVVHLLAVALWRIERAVTAIDREDADRLRHDTLSWINTARKLAETLGLSPIARARLDLNVALAERAKLTNALPLPVRPFAEESAS